MTASRPAALPRATQRWIERTLGAGPDRIRLLGCGTSAQTWSFEIRAADGTDHFVVKQYLDYVIARHPDYVVREVTALDAARTVEVPTPEVVAYDATGADAGTPSVITRRLDGAPDIAPDDLDHWIDTLVSTLATVHSTPLGREFALPAYDPYEQRSGHSIERGWLAVGLLSAIGLANGIAEQAHALGRDDVTEHEAAQRLKAYATTIVL